MNIGTLTGALVLEDQMSGALHSATAEINKFAESFGGLVGTIMKGSVALGAAFAGIAGGIVLLGEKGSTLLGIEDAFDKMAQTVGSTGATMFDALNQGLRGTVDSMEVMQATTKLLSSGIKFSADDMGMMAKTAREMAKATGGDAATALGQLSQAVQTGNTRMLKRIGISVDLTKAERDFATSLGTVRSELSQAGIQQARANAIFEAFGDHLKKTGESALSFKERIQQATVAIGNWFDDLAKGVAKSTAVNRAFETIAKSFEETFGESSQTLLQTLLGWVDKFANAVTRIAPTVMKAFGQIKDGIVFVFDALAAFNERFKVTDTIIAGAQTAWKILTDVFALVKSAIDAVIAAWRSLPEWLQNIGAAALQASVSVAAFSVGLIAVGGPVVGAFINALDVAVTAFASLTDVARATLGIWPRLVDAYKATTVAINGYIVAMRMSTVGSAIEIVMTESVAAAKMTMAAATNIATGALTTLMARITMTSAYLTAHALVVNVVKTAQAAWAIITAFVSTTYTALIARLGAASAAMGLSTIATYATATAMELLGFAILAVQYALLPLALIWAAWEFGKWIAGFDSVKRGLLSILEYLPLVGDQARRAKEAMDEFKTSAEPWEDIKPSAGWRNFDPVIAEIENRMVALGKQMGMTRDQIDQFVASSVRGFHDLKDNGTSAVGALSAQLKALDSVSGVMPQVFQKMADEARRFAAAGATLPENLKQLVQLFPAVGIGARDAGEGMIKASTAAEDFQKKIMDLGKSWANTLAGMTDTAAFAEAFKRLDFKAVMQSPELQMELVPNIDKLIEGHQKLAAGMQEVRLQVQATRIALMAVDKAILEGSGVTLQQIDAMKELGLTEKEIAGNYQVSEAALKKYIETKEIDEAMTKRVAEANAKVLRDAATQGNEQIIMARKKLSLSLADLAGDDVKFAQLKNQEFEENAIKTWKGSLFGWNEYYAILKKQREADQKLAGKEMLKQKEKEYTDFIKSTTLNAHEYKRFQVEQTTKEEIEAVEKKLKLGEIEQEGANKLTEAAIKGGTARMTQLEKERQEMLKNTNIIEIMAQGFVDLAQVIGTVAGATSKFGIAMSALTKGIGASFQMLKMGNAAWKDYKNVLTQTGGVYGKLDQEQIKQVKNFGLATALFDKNATSGQKWASGMASGVQVVSGAMAVYEAGVNSATKSQGAFQGAMAGAQAGAAFGPWGIAIGAVVGAIGGLIAASRAGRKAIKEFAASFDTIAPGTGFDELHAQLLRLGDAGEEMWIDLTQGTAAGNAEEAKKKIAIIQDALAKLDEDISKYGLTIRDLGDAQEAFNKDSQKLVDSFKRLTGAGYRVESVLEGMGGDLNAFIVSSVDAGVKIPAAMQPILEKFIRMGGLTKEAADAILGLHDASMPSLEDIRGAAERYGLSLDALGPKVKQLEITELADQYVTDWGILTKATDDWSGIIDAMQPKVQELITDAMKYGSELPAAMKPMVQAFIDSGKLVDENGEALTDLSQLTWAADLETMVETLVGKMDELIDKIIGGVGGALDEIGGMAVHPRIEPEYIAPNMPDFGGVQSSENAGEYRDEASGYAGGGIVYAAGGAKVQQPSYYGEGSNVIPFTPRGTDTVPAMLTPGERVLTVSEAADYEERGGGGTAIIEVDGETMAKVIVPKMRSVVKRYGLSRR